MTLPLARREPSPAVRLHEKHILARRSSNTYGSQRVATANQASRPRLEFARRTHGLSLHALRIVLGDERRVTTILL
jgi:hypothetical protein